MDIAIQTLRQNRKYVLNSAKFEYSNGPLEGINRKIKTLKRTCYGFANQKFFFMFLDIPGKSILILSLIGNKIPYSRVLLELLNL